MSNMKDRIPICPHGSKESIDIVLVVALEKLEVELGHELDFTSGYRCEACNLAAGGVANSAHLRGKAVDIRCHTSAERFWIVYCCIYQGFGRVGIGKNIVHLDVDTSLPNHVLWLY